MPQHDDPPTRDAVDGAPNDLGAVGWMRSVVIDAADPAVLAAFWCKVLDVEVVEEAADWVQLSPDPGGTFFAFQPSDRPRPTGLVARPDIEVTDIDRARDRVIGFGGAYARTIQELKGDHHYVMTDPEGNEFCLVQPLPPELARERWGDRRR